VRTGKTLAVLVKIHRLCSEYPGTRVLLVRQVFRTLAETVLETFENHVLGNAHPIIPSGDRSSRKNYRYPNGSMIVLGGMDDPQKFMSGEYDLIYFPEAIEGREADLEYLHTRLSSFKTPYRQLIMDCNPGTPSHWLLKRIKRGVTKSLMSRLCDNPRFHDGTDWLPDGLAYMETLKPLTGHRRRRLVDGVWAAPDGARFEGASRQTQGFVMRERFPDGIPSWWKRWVTADWGTANPYCALWHTAGDDGRIYTYREDYLAGLSPSQQIERIKSMSSETEYFEGIWMDRSMWSKEESFGAISVVKGSNIVRIPAADIYNDAIKDDPRFPGLNKGASNAGEQGFVTLDEKLRDGTWMIELGCTNLWDEIEGAVYHMDVRTGIRYELVNPGNSKHCPDHALVASVYGIHKRSPATKAPENGTIDHEAVRIAEMVEMRKAQERNQRTQGKPSWLR
jgi:hypothetical protein